ncbi:MAG: CDP-alcohol phosphatidyltransferase family protein [Coprobacter sp.]|nr:CDP-alcohol phosphatidyltransferase family protein [Coprobacter sp.]
MEKSTSARIQTSILNRVEKKILVWIANRLPQWMTSDILTYIGVLGAVLCAVGFALAQWNLLYLWISSLGLVINWFGDSLDGTLARVRETSRPVYGFFIDHTLDAFTICIMCIGAGLSPMFRLDIALLALAGYLVLSIYTYIGTILKDEFRLTYGSMGPTEFRLAVIIINTVAIYTQWQNCRIQIGGQAFGIFDILGFCIAVLLFAMNICQFLKDRKYFSEKDPVKPYNPNKE